MIRKSVAEILENHVTFELEAIDRMYLNAYVPSLQTGAGFVYFVKTQLGARVRAELLLLNASAAASLDEGLEETLTLHRLGIFRELGTSLKTTNALESIHARVESRIAKVDHWRNSEQKQRWLATAFLDLEPRLRRIRNFRALPLLREAMKRHIEGMKKSAA